MAQRRFSQGLRSFWGLSPQSPERVTGSPNDPVTPRVARGRGPPPGYPSLLPTDGVKYPSPGDPRRSVMATHLLPETANKARVKEAAQKEQVAVREAARKHGVPAPRYEFLELIGKGTFGRVYKSKDLQTGVLVAIKIVNIDKSDYEGDPTQKDETIKDLVNEIKVLQQLKDTKAKNINLLEEAFAFHSQLWIVSEYCSGGSLYTLMKASVTKGFDEKYIIPIARELAEALKSVHDAGIIHRDVKAANVLISEKGHLQLCDFGVSGVLENKVDKRSTIIGTPFWMPPEMHKDGARQLGYGYEVDVWAFGCTIFEITTGLPPNARIRPDKLGTVLSSAPRLEGGDYSTALRDFIAFCLEERPNDRPTMDSILKQPLVVNTAKKYPMRSLKELVEIYARWEKSGGQRASLFQPGGAAAAEVPDQQEDDVWNFSTTADFDLNLEKEVTSPFVEIYVDSPISLSGSQSRKPSTSSIMSPEEKIRNEQRVIRGGRAMEALFDENAAPYEYHIKDQMGNQSSDLPLRQVTDRSSIRDTQIDLGEYDSETGYSSIPNLDLANVPTIKASKSARRIFADTEDEEEDETKYNYDSDNVTRRATKDWKMPWATDRYDRRVTKEWKFPTMVPDEGQSSSSVSLTTSGAPGAPVAPHRPRLLHTATAPVGAEFGNTFLETVSAPESPTHSKINLDIGDDLDDVPRPSTASSFNGSVSTDITTGDPFDLEKSLDKGKGRLDERFDSIDNLDDFDDGTAKRYSHKFSKSEPANLDTNYRGPSIADTLALPSTSNHQSRQASISSGGTEYPRVVLTEEEKKEAMDEWHAQLEEEFDAPYLSGPLENFDIPYPTGELWERFDLSLHPENVHPFVNRGFDTARVGDPDFPLPNGTLLRTQPTPPLELSGPGSQVDSLASSPPDSPVYSVENSQASSPADTEPVPDMFGPGGIFGPGGQFPFPDVPPPSAEALMEGASDEVLESELIRMLTAFRDTVNVTRDVFQAYGRRPDTEAGPAPDQQ